MAIHRQRLLLTETSPRRSSRSRSEVLGGFMTDEVTTPRLTEEQLQLASQLESIFMPQAKRQRDEAYAKLRETGSTDGQLRFVHYTSAEAALKIIHSKRLWMRN